MNFEKTFVVKILVLLSGHVICVIKIHGDIKK